MTEIDKLAQLEAEHAKRVAALKEVEAQLTAIRAANRAAKLTEIKKQIADYGFTAADLFEPPKPQRKRTAKNGEASKSATEAKYRNPTTGETWGGGRGRKPAWVVEAIAKGIDIETFLIQKTA